MKATQIAVAAVLSAIAGPRLIEGHGYVTSPRSRNQLARPVEDGGIGADAIDPTGNIVDEYCPHCLNRKDKDGVCGQAAGRKVNNYDDWVKRNGDPIPFDAQGTYSEGDVIVVETTLATYHMGHMELRACPYTVNPTQACFDAHPLTFLQDLSLNGDLPAMPDYPDYPERAYYGPSSGGNAADRSYTFLYRLPPVGDGIIGKVLLQYQYVTANYCNEKGYDDYFNTAGPGYESWWAPSLQTCTAIHPEGLNRSCGKGKDDRVCGERFWNCIEIEVIP